MTIKDNLLEIMKRKKDAALRSGRKDEDILMLAVTKKHTAEEINEAIDAGVTDIGENKVQEILEKYDKVKPVRWHLIGHLQTNKVKSIIDKVVMIHSVDSQHLAKEIDKRAAAKGITMDILIQINSAMEQTKTGIPAVKTEELIRNIAEECSNINIKGIMCIPPYNEDTEKSRKYFREAEELFERMKSIDFGRKNVSIEILSMGMSGDFEIAIEEGSTIVRVGTAIFGKRDYR